MTVLTMTLTAGFFACIGGTVVGGAVVGGTVVGGTVVGGAVCPCANQPG